MENDIIVKYYWFLILVVILMIFNEINVIFRFFF
jgi:hypothetical protein